MFAQTVDLGTYGGVSGDWATYMTMSGTATRGWIWKAGTTDSLGVQEFFKANQENYFFNERIDAVVASSANIDDIKIVAQLLQQGESPEQIKDRININDEVHVIFTSAKMDVNHQAIPKDFIFKNLFGRN